MDAIPTRSQPLRFLKSDRDSEGGKRTDLTDLTRSCDVRGLGNMGTVFDSSPYRYVTSFTKLSWLTILNIPYTIAQESKKTSVKPRNFNGSYETSI
jgi:hypothetical protein